MSPANPRFLRLYNHGRQIGGASLDRQTYYQRLGAAFGPDVDICCTPVAIPAKLLGERAKKKAAPAPQRKTMLAGPHRCTCGCEETGVCRCPNCSVGCGFLPPPPEKKKE